MAQRQRIRRPPRDATLPLNPFEIPDQQQAKIPPWRQRRTPHRLRVEALTLPLYKLVEPTLLQQLVQPLVERMCHRPRPLRLGNPILFLRFPLLRSSSHLHARSLRTSALDYARNFTSESRLSPRTASLRSSPPQSHFACFGACVSVSRGRCSGSARRAGFPAGAVIRIGGVAVGLSAGLVSSRFAWSSSSRNSSCWICRCSFSDLRPNCMRCSLAISSFRCAISLSRESSC